MRNITTLLAVLLLTMILGLNATAVMAYEVAYVRLTGTLLPVEEEGRGGLRDTLDVNIDGKVWVFRLAKVQNLKANGFGREIFRHVVPAGVRFVGSEDHIHNLQKPEMADTRLTITGFLYPVSRTFFITAMDEVKKARTN